MSKNFFDVAHAHSKASNKNSAMAVSGGLSYSPSHRGHEDFETPPPFVHRRDLRKMLGGDWFATQQVLQLYGFKSFRLTVLGKADEQGHRTRNARYVCKCSCGMYCYRTAKKLRTIEYQACGVCLKNRERIRNEHHRKTGVYLDDSVVWQRMGGA